ncbi:hypothetical protein D3C72_2207840 [compost metagenome]
MPLARLFFEPQNTAVISSSTENPSRRAVKVVIPSTTNSRIAAISITAPMVCHWYWCHRPSAVASQNEE